MSNIKITVIRKFHSRDVFGEDFVHPSGNIAKECEFLPLGAEFVIKEGKMPENFCSWAWRDIYKDAAVLRFGGEFDHTLPGVMYTCCTDGIRPVCFKMERI